MKQSTSSKQIRIFNTECLPYIYHSEYYSLAWEHEHYGFYTDPEGRTYRYIKPDKWNFHSSLSRRHVWGYETDGTIEPDLLFQNLASSVSHSSFFRIFRKQAPITEAIIEDLIQSRLENHGQVRCDAGHKSNSLLVYDSTANLYKRILLNCGGDNELINQSPYAKQIVQRFGTVY